MTTLDQISVNQVNQNGFKNRKSCRRITRSKGKRYKSGSEGKSKGKQYKSSSSPEDSSDESSEAESSSYDEEDKKKQRKKMPGFVYFF